MEVPWVVKPVAEGSSIGVNIVKGDEPFAEDSKTHGT